MSLLRDFFLSLSRNKWMQERAPRYGFVRRSVRRFLPGEHLEDALGAARQLAGSGVGTLLTQLGENIADRSEAEQVTQHYLGVLARIREMELTSEISVKLTQLGFDLDRNFCFENLSKLIAASPPERTVWIDMEHAPYVDYTLEIYHRARKKYRNVGVCVQAYLYRTEKDVEALIAIGASVRLVKGAYNEPAEIAFPKKRDVDENYFALAQRLLSPEARQAGVRAAIATHDRNLIARINAWATTQHIEKKQIEFAMLYGIQRAELQRLVKEGYRCGVLVSYGSFWFPWFMRRLAERPANVLFLARNLLSK
jgi:proline dehydrogenase